jgi:D-alanine transaminase
MEKGRLARIAYVNGRYRPFAEATVSIDDRAFTFGDGVYEVCEVWRGALIEETRHLDRLQRSLAAVRIDWPIGREALRFVMRQVVRRNRVRDGLVYVQISRGAARRDHGFPPKDVRPGLAVSARALDPSVNAARAAAGVAVVTVPETRWAHPHIKTLQLLPNVLAKQAAREAGAFEAWFVDRDGFVTEGASTNAWIVAGDGALVTRQADDSILRGVDQGGADRRCRRARPQARRAAVQARRGARRP